MYAHWDVEDNSGNSAYLFIFAAQSDKAVALNGQKAPIEQTCQITWGSLFFLLFFISFSTFSVHFKCA